MSGKRGERCPDYATSDLRLWSLAATGSQDGAMSGLWFDVMLVAFLIGVNVALAGSEMAFVSLREGQVRRLSTTGQRGERVARLAGDPNRYLSAVQLGITFSGFLASATVAVSMSEPVADRFGALGRFATPVAVGLVTLGVALVSLVLGELVPKRVAMQRAQRWSLVVVRPLTWFIAVTRPVIVVLSAMTDVVVRAVGGDPDRHRDVVTDEEIVDFVEAQPHLTETQRQIMSGAIEIAERTLRHVLVPRTRVVSLDADMSAVDGLLVLRSADHSRAPVVTGSLDEPVGQVRLRDLIDVDGKVRDVATPILSLPESLSVLESLRQLQTSRTQLAAVVDEHGGTAGIITVEDLVEELVGEIYDEADLDILSVVHDDTGALVLPGSFPIHDLIDLDITVPAGSFVTLAGLVLAELGHLADVGDHVIVGGYDFEVLELDGRSIELVRLVAAPTGGPPMSTAADDSNAAPESDGA